MPRSHPSDGAVHSNSHLAWAIEPKHINATAKSAEQARRLEIRFLKLIQSMKSGVFLVHPCQLIRGTSEMLYLGLMLAHNAFSCIHGSSLTNTLSI